MWKAQFECRWCAIVNRISAMASVTPSGWSGLGSSWCVHGKLLGGWVLALGQSWSGWVLSVDLGCLGDVPWYTARQSECFSTLAGHEPTRIYHRASSIKHRTSTLTITTCYRLLLANERITSDQDLIANPPPPPTRDAKACFIPKKTLTMFLPCFIDLRRNQTPERDFPAWLANSRLLTFYLFKLVSNTEISEISPTNSTRELQNSQKQSRRNRKRNKPTTKICRRTASGRGWASERPKSQTNQETRTLIQTTKARLQNEE